MKNSVRKCFWWYNDVNIMLCFYCMLLSPGTPRADVSTPLSEKSCIFITTTSHEGSDLSTHQPLDVLFKMLSRITTNKTIKVLCLTVTSGNPASMTGPTHWSHIIPRWKGLNTSSWNEIGSKSQQINSPASRLTGTQQQNYQRHYLVDAHYLLNGVKTPYHPLLDGVDSR